MAQRVFGPIRGAGVQVTEMDGAKPIEPGALGWAGYAGVLERGEPGELIVCSSWEQFLRKCGGYTPDSLLPDAAKDFFDNAQGGGGLFLVRVTDGNEEKATLDLYARRKTPTLVGRLEAKSGGRWGGKAAIAAGTVATADAIKETTLETGKAMKVDEWAGGYLSLGAVPNARFLIVGNTEDGTIRVAADQKMRSAAGAAPTDLSYTLELENAGRALAAEFHDGEDNPDTEFGLFIYVDGALTIKWPNLSMDPASPRYWVRVINDDTSNEEVRAVSTWTGAVSADLRPASVYGETVSVNGAVLAAKIHSLRMLQGSANPEVDLGVTTAQIKAQTLTLTMTSDTTFDVESDKLGSLGTGEIGTAFDAPNGWTPSFTLTNGDKALESGDKIELVIKPLPAGLAGGYLYPNKTGAKRARYRIVANDHNTITTSPGTDLAAEGEAGADFMVVAPVEFAGGKDGVAGLTDAHFIQQAWDVASSPFTRISGLGVGLVKFATPGVTATAVQKAGVAFAAAHNHQYRYEIPANITTEEAADAYVNETLGRSDYAVTIFPSFVYKLDPEGAGTLKLVSATGMVHGREARIANDFLGYHKAAAGVDAILPAVLDLPTRDRVLNEEILNPRGINVIKRVKGNYVIWGDRTLSVDPNWKFKHQRELMSYYEHVLQTSFDWIVFAINDSGTRKTAITSLISFFLPEWRKGALRGDTFESACEIKIDAENNTDATMAEGDMYADVSLRLADTVERFRIRVGKMGIFEAAV